MQIGMKAAQIAMSDLGWSVSESPIVPFFLVAHKTLDDQACAVLVWMTFDDEYRLRTWSIYRTQILPDRETPQVVQKLEDLPALDLWVLPNPVQVYKLLIRAGEDGIGMRLVEQP